MRYKKSIEVLTLCTSLLLSSCNTDKPAVTSAVTEEVTKTITAEVTTVANTTTAALTTTTSATTTTAIKTAEPEDSEPEIDPLTAELRELTEKYLLFSDIAGMHLMAEQVEAYRDCNIYEWENVKTWDDFKQLIADIFTGELYDSTTDHYNYSINMPERGSVMSVDGKIGYAAADDFTLVDAAIYDSSDIEVLSEDGDSIMFRCAGGQHIGNISTGIDEHLYIRFDAVRTDDVLKIEHYEYESDIGDNHYLVTDFISDKLDVLNKQVYDYISDPELGIVIAAVSAPVSDSGYDIYRFDESSAELLFSVPRTGTLSHVARHKENGEEFLIIYFAGAVGRGYPATIITMKDDELVILSEYDPDDAEYNGLFYYPAYDLIGERGVGISAGCNNFIPYHFNGEAFVPYRLHEIRKEYLHELDTDKVVPDLYSAVSVFFRENGLIHVNYRDMSECEDVCMGDNSPTASLTFVYENGNLRRYDQEHEAQYGSYIEKLPVIDNIAAEGVPEDMYDIELKRSKEMGRTKRIELKAGEVPDISGLADVEGLSLLVDDDGMSDLSFVGELTGLRSLYICVGAEEPWKLPLPETHIKSYDFLKKLGKLEYLSIDGEYEFDLGCLDGLGSLVSLSLNACETTGTTRLEKMQFLTVLVSGISEETIVTGFPNLKYLEIGGSSISITPLCKLKKLEYMQVYLGTPIDDIAAVTECKCLKFLHMTTDKVAPDDRFLLEMSDLMRLNYCFGTFTEETIEKLHEMYPYIEIRGFEPAF